MADNHPHSFSIWIGIDWADREHAVCVVAPQGVFHEQVPHTPEDLAQWVQDLQGRFGPGPFAVGLEQKYGGLVHALMQFDTLVLYPVNPRQLSSYREALAPSGAKDDPGDAWLLADFVRLHHHRLKPWQPDDPETRKLDRLCQLRRRLVEDRKQLGQKLLAALKMYFPMAIELAAGRMHAPLLLALLKRWPSLTELRRAHPRTLRTFFARFYRDADRLEQILQRVRQAAPLTTDRAIIEPHALMVPVFAAQIECLNDSITQFDKRIAEISRRHEDVQLFRQTGGAGDALAPRLAAAFGSDRSRFDNASEVQTLSGIAPVTKRSGRSRTVHRRHACSKFLRQTFQEFAEHARRYSQWSRAYYQLQRSRGKKHHAAVRALAFKWIRILFQVWKTRTPYDEAQHLDVLQRRNSPILQFLNNP